MTKYLVNKKGVAIFMVLATILIVVILANVILAIISNQSRLSRHEVGRIQAYYAAKAGIVYALEKLRNGTWVYGSNCTAGSPCEVPPAATYPNGDVGFAPYIVNNRALVIFCPNCSSCDVGGGSVACNSPNPAPNNFCVQSFVNYTYTP